MRNDGAETMTVSRRALMLASGLIAAWASTPVRAAAGSLNFAADRERLRSLVAEMTISEKAGQLTLLPTSFDASGAAFNPASPGEPFERQIADVERGELGGVLNGASLDGHRALQQAAMRSRLRIPMIFGADVIHGYRTVFPVPLAESASFDPALAERTARIAAIEASASGLCWTFAPMVDVARDARWGRGVEGAGEDVLLGRDMAAARVRGFQGRSLADSDALLACPKHFAAYGAGAAGVDYAEVEMSERLLREVYLPPFEAGFAAGALSTMASFNAFAGVPATANRWLLTKILRGDLGFKGFVVSDWASDLELIDHGVAEDERSAAKLAIMAGVDMSMGSDLYRRHLPDLVARGDVPIERVDEAVLSVLSVKHTLGLFADPFGRIDAKRAKRDIFTAGHLAVARDAARRSVVMLKNDNDLLPLQRSGNRIALIGPFAEGRNDLNGPWTIFGRDSDSIDLASGIRETLHDPRDLTVVAGCGVDAPIAGGLEAALAAAQDADVVMLAIGESQNMSGEAKSRASIGLPEAQLALVRAVARSGKRTVVLLRNGRALALDDAILAADAILVTWFLGTMTGPAIADLLFGLAAPSARLPVSFPKLSGQSPYHYDHLPSGRPGKSDEPERFKSNFIETANRARFPFGHGVTFGKIIYRAFRQSAPILRAGEVVELTATIANEGRYAAKVYSEAFEDRRPSLGDDMSIRRYADVPMAALWAFSRGGSPRSTLLGDMRGAASVAHLYGQNIAAAESMTSSLQPWAHGPADLRRVIDLAFANGINRPVIHTSVHQPRDDMKPGLPLWIFGQYFTRHETWAEMAKPWIDYIARNSFLLQQGRNHADVAYFYGEDSPLTAIYAENPLADVPVSYAYDFVNADALLTLLTVDDGVLRAPSGARYNTLYLGGTSSKMTLSVLRRIATFAEGGLTIVGRAPTGSPALGDDQREFHAIVARLWDGNPVTKVGKGKVVDSDNVETALRASGVTPDFDYVKPAADSEILFVHRTLPDGELYFLNNRRDRTEAVEARFGVTGKQPELWRADTGQREPLGYRTEGDVTIVPLEFAPEDSFYVLFRKDSACASAVIEKPVYVPAGAIEGPWKLEFEAGRGAPEGMDVPVLASLSAHDDPRVKYFSGVATYSRRFELPAGVEAGKSLLLDLGQVADVAEVRINGILVGTVWKAPYRLDIGMATTQGTNRIEVRVANLWANRLIGDAQPGANKIASTTQPAYLPAAPLRPSGLIGPVRLLSRR